MYFKQFLDERCGCASYLLASRKTHDAAIVDPSADIEEYEMLLHERDFQLRYVIDTHVHADHVSGARLLASRYGAMLCLHESARVEYPFRGLMDGEVLELGTLQLWVVHTPGHRPELISLLVVNPERSAEPSMVLTGDSLLVGDVGRPDFGGGDAAAQFRSITRLMDLPDWVAVFPGHFEGPCGKGMCGRPSTTIGFERRYNPLTQLGRDEFISALTGGVPARPLNMVAIEATNRGAAAMPWAMLTTHMAVPDVDIVALERRTTDTLVLDVREPEEYARGHVPGALNVPQAMLASQLDAIPRTQAVYVICEGGFRSLRAAQFLSQAGYPQVSNVKGGTAAWRNAGKPLRLGAVDPEAPVTADSEWAHAGASTV